jgi:hypothetical protein
MADYLHRMETPEMMWRMALATFNAENLSDLTHAQAHEIMVRARQRYGSPEAAKS